MRCRTFVKENDTNNIVWFGSYGKEVLSPRQQWELRNNYYNAGNYNLPGQTFTLKIRTGNMSESPYCTRVRFYNSTRDIIWDSIELYEENKEYILSGTVEKTVSWIRIENSSSLVRPVFTWNEYSKAKRNYDSNENEYNGKKQALSNFSSDAEAVANDLTQKLSVMKGELWHSTSFGLPLLEKIKSKALIDSAAAKIILSQDKVIGIINFKSAITQKEYHCEVNIQTEYGNVLISI